VNNIVATSYIAPNATHKDSNINANTAINNISNTAIVKLIIINTKLSVLCRLSMNVTNTRHIVAPTATNVPNPNKIKIK
jgi:hypothetical protein